MQIKRYICLILGLYWNTAHGMPLHHQFNTSLLKPGETQASIYGNLRHGVSEELELGTQGLFLLGGITNLSLKHHMFTKGATRTAFSSHSYLMKNGDPELFAALSLHGVITDYTLRPGMNLTMGIFDFFAWVKGDENLLGEFHNITPMIGTDMMLPSGYGLTLLVFLPLWGNLELVSNYADLSGQFQYYQGVKSEEGYPGLLFFSMTRSWESTHFEFGALYFNPAKKIIPYLNLFWRWI